MNGARRRFYPIAIGSKSTLPFGRRSSGSAIASYRWWHAGDITGAGHEFSVFCHVSKCLSYGWLNQGDIDSCWRLRFATRVPRAKGVEERCWGRGRGVRRSWMDARGASGDAWMEAVWRWWKSTLEKRLSLSLSLVHPVSFYFPFSVTTLPSWSTRRSNKSDVNNVIVGRSGRKRWRHHFILEWRCGWINDVLKRLFRMVESARVDSRKDLEQWDEYPDVTRIPIVVALLWCFRNF